jgi:hypothetical protein
MEPQQVQSRVLATIQEIGLVKLVHLLWSLEMESSNSSFNMRLVIFSWLIIKRASVKMFKILASKPLCGHVLDAPAMLSLPMLAI